MPEAPARRIQSSKDSFGRGLVRLIPDLSEVFLQVVGAGERLVQSQSFFEAFTFVALVVQVFGILQQEPSNPFNTSFWSRSMASR